MLLVRVDQETVKAFHNVCQHRGTALADGCGHFERGRIICPFHGWRWDLEGKNQFVLERQEYRDGQLQDSDVALKEIKTELFAGFVFINFDRNPVVFDEFIAPVRQLVEDLATADMRHYWWKSIAVPANWKVAQEAFLEAFHVPATHPQLEKVGREVIYGDLDDADFTHRNVKYDSFALGHGRFYGVKTPMTGHVQQPAGDPVEAMAARLNLLVEGMDAMVLAEDVAILRSLRGKEIPAGSSLGGEYVRALYTRAAEQQRPMPKPKPEIIGMWGGEVFIFPNLDDPAPGRQFDDLPRPAGWRRSQSFDLRDLLDQDLSSRCQAAARHGRARDGSRRSGTAAADPAPGSLEYPSHAEGAALTGHPPDLARRRSGKAAAQHAPGTRPLPAILTDTLVSGIRAFPASRPSHPTY